MEYGNSIGLWRIMEEDVEAVFQRILAAAVLR